MMDTVERDVNRKLPMSLDTLCQIQVIKMVHVTASKMESDYMDKWLENDLTVSNRDLEQTMNIRDSKVDTEEVVIKYHSREAEDFIRKKQLLESQMTLKGNNGGSGSSGGGGGSSSKGGGGGRTRKKGRGKNNRHCPYPVNNNLVTTQTLKPKIIRGIPEGASVTDYIQYRKCKYIEDIKLYRSTLVKRLNPRVLNNLMTTMTNIAQFNNKHEHGLLTLQAILMNGYITNFRIAPAKFYRNFLRETSMSIDGPRHNDHLETRIGTTILHYMLIDGIRLTHLDLEKCACDSLLRLLSDVATNLRYLNISGSVVSDQGLLSLCGVEKVILRPRLSRACKSGSGDEDRLVKNEMPRWAKKRQGCERLNHLEANNLLRLEWPGHQQMYKYYDFVQVPLDSGFVAVILYLKELRIFMTEVGIRTIQSAAKVRSKMRKAFHPLKIQVISESHLTPPLVSALDKHCPDLRDLQVDWHEFFSPQMHQCEDWVASLFHEGKCPKITSLKTRNIFFRSSKLQAALNVIGHRLTLLDFREIFKFRYSNFRALRTCCPNLESLTMFITMKNAFTTIEHIEVDKDFNLGLNIRQGSVLSKLTQLHLSGPFGSDVAKYLLINANGVKSLTLGIEWPEQIFCDAQPSGIKDVIGIEFLKEVFSVNDLKQLEELHLMAQYRRGRNRLTYKCAEFVIRHFPKLRHFGNFQYWKLSRSEETFLFHRIKSENRAITFDEDLYTSNSETPVFEYRYVEDRHKFACNDIVLKKGGSSGFLSNIFEVLAGNIGEDALDSDAESDDSLIDEILPDDGNSSDDDSDLEDGIMEVDVGGPLDGEPMCTIM